MPQRTQRFFRAPGYGAIKAALPGMRQDNQDTHVQSPLRFPPLFAEMFPRKPAANIATPKAIGLFKDGEDMLT